VRLNSDGQRIRNRVDVENTEYQINTMYIQMIYLLYFTYEN